MILNHSQNNFVGIDERSVSTRRSIECHVNVQERIVVVTYSLFRKTIGKYCNRVFDVLEHLPNLFLTNNTCVLRALYGHVFIA